MTGGFTETPVSRWSRTIHLENLKMSDIRKLSTSDDNFQQQLDALLAWESVSDTGVNDTVNQIGRAHV